MVFRIFKSIFSNDAVKAKISNDVEELIALLNNISNGLGEYASVAFNEKNPSKKNRKASEMLSIITEIEKVSVQLKSTVHGLFEVIIERNTWRNAYSI